MLPIILTEVPEVPAEEVVETTNKLVEFFTETLPEHMSLYWHWYLIGILVVTVVLLAVSKKDNKRKKYYRKG
ncbi:hypothetical protein [Acholeplasma hippikon]|nr:hypothetical protein [Acholeplasma hippikon]